ncbi:YlbF family regulator [Paenibacillus thiaminolyticus]|nr:YlbF family regulator [Paenibacillus thiaminolyticus]
MSVGQYESVVDMTVLLTNAYQLGDMINQSVEVAEYLYWKERMEQNAEVDRLVREFARKKELFEETERFGHFHPDYHRAKDEVMAVQAQLDAIDEVSRFKQAEKALDELLHGLSEVIAHAVSDTIKVPGNDPLPSKGCGSGGCSGGCSSCS